MTLKPLECIYKRTLKVFDKKLVHYHHCPILNKYNLLSWENMIKYANVCLMYTIVYGLSSPPLGQLVRTRTTDYRSTRRALRGDYHKVILVIEILVIFCQSCTRTEYYITNNYKRSRHICFI